MLDANILIRFFVSDNLDHAGAVKRLLLRARKGNATLMVPYIAIVETVHVLRTAYSASRIEIATNVTAFLSAPGVNITAPIWVFDALAEFGRRNVSFGDACIAAEARHSGMTVASFDGDFDKFEGIKRLAPA